MITAKKEKVAEIKELKDLINDHNKRKRDLDDEGDNSRRGGPSAGTTGGSSLPPQACGGSEGVEGSSKRQSPLDYVIGIQDTEMPDINDTE